MQDYSRGLLFVACITISFFSIWGFLLLLFKCLGKKRVGVLSGDAFQKPNRHATIGRTIFGISLLFLWISSILFMTKGVAEWQASANLVDDVNSDIRNAKDDLQFLSERLKWLARDTVPVRGELVQFLESQICPLSTSKDDLHTISDSTLQSLQDLDEFLVDELLELQEELFEPIEHATDHVDRGLQYAQFDTVEMAFLMLPYLIIPALFLVALIMSICGLYSVAYNKVLQWFCMPLLILWTILAYMGAAWLAVSVESNADFCSGGATDTPEASVSAILEQYNLMTGESFYADVIQFYVGQCQSTSNPWAFLLSYQDSLLNAQSNVQDIIIQLSSEGGVAQLSTDCGVDWTAVQVLLNYMAKELEQLTATIARSINLIQCESIVPLYTTAVYDTTCNDAIQAGAWGYGTLFAMAFFGMMAITYRGAYAPIFYDDDDEEGVAKSLGFPSSSQDEDDEFNDLRLHEDDDGEEDGAIADIVVTSSDL